MTERKTKERKKNAPKCKCCTKRWWLFLVVSECNEKTRKAVAPIHSYQGGEPQVFVSERFGDNIQQVAYLLSVPPICLRVLGKTLFIEGSTWVSILSTVCGSSTWPKQRVRKQWNRYICWRRSHRSYLLSCNGEYLWTPKSCISWKMEICLWHWPLGS